MLGVARWPLGVLLPRLFRRLSPRGDLARLRHHDVLDLLEARRRRAQAAHERAQLRPSPRLGFAFFLVLIGVQATLGLAGLAFAAIVGTPESRSRDFADLVSRRPELKDAILIGDPDYMLEPMHYYLPNRTYFVREQRYGKYIHFTRKARLDLTLSDILDEARAIRSSTARPVAILLAWRLGEMDPARVYRESYVWTFSAPGDQIERFREATTLLAQFPRSHQQRKL